jgi:hypothetical protein
MSSFYYVMLSVFILSVVMPFYLANRLNDMLTKLLSTIFSAVSRQLARSCLAMLAIIYMQGHWSSSQVNLLRHTSRYVIFNHTYIYVYIKRYFYIIIVLPPYICVCVIIIKLATHFTDRIIKCARCWDG